MSTTDTDALTEVVRELIRDKGDRVHEWPDDEAAAYRDNGGFAPGRAAVEEVRVAKGVAAVKEAVAEEVRKAKAEALREVARGFFAMSPHITYSGQHVQERLLSRADRYETGDQR